MPAGRGNLSVATLLDERAAQHPDRIMMVNGGTPVTFAQLRDRSCRIRKDVLRDRGPGTDARDRERHQYIVSR